MPMNRFRPNAGTPTILTALAEYTAAPAKADAAHVMAEAIFAASAKTTLAVLDAALADIAADI